ncbi:MAG: hypothetical protein IPQ10_08730 [Saprospiraceae bacterium]|nr:hypothetical protein [Saprospiraceae bacterium]MBK7796024.1 hypothetical protein [Saprospiraceae bacterium]MBK8151789.1 hypothetical protein [Saprospiraceae bacterium]MBL0261133.1 hypothetical protein [Saprospiraceae bacterium]
MNQEIIIAAIDALKIIGPSVILPIFILWMTNRNARKNREIEQEFELKKLQKNKELDVDYSIELNRKKHHIIVHSALVNILFDIQKLHISLSGHCSDVSCIDDAMKEFQNKFTEQQAKISEYQIFLSSNITNRLYKFYSLLGELAVELREIKESKQFEIAIASVYNYSVRLAEEIIYIQNEILAKRKELNSDFNTLELPYFRSCCGQEPPDNIKQQYENIRKKKMAIASALDKLPLELPVVLEKEIILNQ